MRLLAVSDIHNNVASVRKLRAQEENHFDVVAVGGDIGSHRAAEIFEILTSFSCPVVYVHGNWDSELDYGEDFGPNTYLLHLNIITIGTIHFAGFSEFRSARDPHPMGIRESVGEYYRRRAERLSRLLCSSNLDLGRTVLITHQRLTRLAERFPGLLLHIFGHNHTFDVFDRRGSLHVNISTLDRILPVRPLAKRLKSGSFNSHTIRHVNAGNYAVIEVPQSGRPRVECRFLQHPYEGWIVAPGAGMFSGALVPEEAIFGDNRRFMRAMT